MSEAESPQSVQTGGDAVPFPPKKQAYFSLFVMTIVVMFTVLDRQVLSLMIDPIKDDFKITDTQAALLIGAAFSITYGIAGMPIARLADRTNRRNLVAACIAFWSACTMLSGVAQSYMGMVLARIGVGVGESGYGPASWSIITDTFPREKVAFATGVMGLGAMTGTGLALFAGGVVLSLVSQFEPVSIGIFGVIRPWQWAFIIVGFPGLLWTLVVMMTKEPARRGLVAGTRPKPVPLREVGRWLMDSWRTYLAVIGGGCLRILLGAGVATWGPTFLHREFGWSLAKAGITTGIITLVVSPIGMILGGKLSEHWTRKGIHDANLRIVLISMVLSAPILAISPLLHDPWLIQGLTAVALFFGALCFGPGIASFQVVTPNTMRAQISSLYQFSSNVIAFALSPLIVAVMTDYVFGDPSKLKYSMSLNAVITGVLVVLVTWQGLKPYARSYERAVRENL